MPVSLGKYGWLAQVAIDFGFPILGNAFHIPGAVSDYAANKLKEFLGLKPSATDAEVANQIQGMDPDSVRTAFEGAQSEVQAKYAYLTRVAEVQGQVLERSSTNVNQTMQIEARTEISWYHWRHLIGYVVGFHLLAGPIAVFFILVFGTTELRGVMKDFMGELVAILGIGSALLGAVAWDNTRRTGLAVEVTKDDGMISNLAKTVVGKKK